MMKIAKKQVQITLVVIIVLAAFVLLFPGAFGWCIRSHELRQVNRVLDSNPDQILLACRDMLTRREQFEPMVNHRFGDYASVRGDSLGDAPVPPIISGLHPRDITFSSNSVSVDVTNPFNPFGPKTFYLTLENYMTLLEKSSQYQDVLKYSAGWFTSP